MKGLSPHPTKYSDSDICEDDLHAIQLMEGGMNFLDMPLFPGVFMGIKQENVKYMDVIDVAQTVFESDIYATTIV